MESKLFIPQSFIINRTGEHYWTHNNNVGQIEIGRILNYYEF